MTFGLYVIYDKVGDEYSLVFQQKNDKVCCRVVHDLFVKSPIFPEDYQIIKVGTFDNETGICLAFDHVVVCGNCLDLFSDEEKKSLNIQPSLFSEEVDNE